MYSVHDIKSGIFMPPNHFVNEQAALRAYKSQFSKGDSLVAEFPEDYRIYHIGRFDDSRGTVLPLDTPKMVIDVHALLHNKE